MALRTMHGMLEPSLTLFLLPQATQSRLQVCAAGGECRTRGAPTADAESASVTAHIPQGAQGSQPWAGKRPGLTCMGAAAATGQRMKAGGRQTGGAWGARMTCAGPAAMALPA